MYMYFKSIFTAICAEKCLHGICIGPDKCKCDIGWSGLSCNECIKMPGCIHGDCVDMTNTCICNEGWTGPLCTEPICASGCNIENAICLKVK